MKILKLYLHAFGPFSEHMLDFSSGREGVHLVHGPNAAGKSSSLRALTGMLFGFQNHSADTLLHSELLVGARLRHWDGREMNFLRRKGQENTLLDAQGSAIPEKTINPFLNGVTHEMFASFFGIGQQALTKGGADLLKGKGGLGESLFSSGLGNQQVLDLLQTLDQKSEELFLPGKEQGLNQSILGYQEAKARCEEGSLSSQVWLQIEKSLNHNRKDLKKLNQSIDEHQAELANLLRYQKALPALEEYQVLQTTLKELGALPELAPDFSETYRGLKAQLNDAESQGVLAHSEFTRIEKELEPFSISEAFLKQDSVIEDLYHRLSDYRMDQAEKQRREQDIAQLEKEAQDLLSQLPTALQTKAKGKFRLGLEQHIAIQELGSQAKGLETQSKVHSSAIAALTTKVEEAKKHMTSSEPGPSLHKLQNLILEAEHLRHVPAQLQDMEATYQKDLEAAHFALNRLSHWEESLESLEKAPMPSMETVNRFEIEWQKIRKTSEQVKERQTRLKSEVNELGRQLKELQSGSEIADPKELEAARHLRDKDWQGVRMQLDAKPTRRKSTSGLLFNSSAADDFEKSVTHADELADQLIRDVEGLVKFAFYSTQKEKLDAELKELASGQRVATRTENAFLKDWQKLWEPVNIEPLPPAEMRAWLQHYQELLFMAQALRSSKSQMKRMEDQISGLVLKFQEALGKINENTDEIEDLLGWIELARKSIETQQSLRSERDESLFGLENLQGQLHSAEQGQKVSEAEYSAWKRSWKQAMDPLKLPKSTLPAKANEILVVLHELGRRQDEIEKLQASILQTRGRIETFETEANALIQVHAPELKKEVQAKAISMVHSRLEKMRRDGEKVALLQKEKKAVQAQLDESLLALEQHQSDLHSMREQAGCTSEEEMDHLEACLEQAQSLNQSLTALENQLSDLAGDAELEPFLEFLSDLEVEKLVENIGSVQDSLNQLESDQKELKEQATQIEEELKKMDGGSRAAEAAENAQNYVAQIRDGAHRYLRAKLSSHILNQEIERYRLENQEPLLKKAGTHLARLSLGEFKSLGMALADETKLPIVVGVRRNGKPELVENMGERGRDQLYLALRLAHLQRYIEAHEPFPFIVDDILGTFEDQEAGALLELLGELSRQTQILLFTHQDRYLKMAKTRLMDNSLFIHSLANK